MSGEVYCPHDKILTNTIKGQANNDLAYDHPGTDRLMIMTDRVPRGISVTTVYCHDFMQKLHRNMHTNQHDLLRNRPLILHDNACPHLKKAVTDLLNKYKHEVLPYMPCNPDMSPPDFEIIP